MVVGDRQVGTIDALLGRQEAAPAARLVGRAPGLLDRDPRHHLGLPRLQPRGRAPDAGGLQVHLHARDDHPGRQAAGRGRPRPDPHQPQDPRVAAVPVESRAYVRRNALSIFRVYSQYEPLKVFWTGALILGLAALALFIRFLVFFVAASATRARGHVQSLIAGARAVHRRDAARRARRDRRPARRPAHALAADVRAGAPDRAAARRRALALRAGAPAAAPSRSRRARTRQREPRAPRTAGRSRYELQRPTSHRRGAGPVPTGNTFDKYGSTNPVVRRLMAGFERTLDELFARAGAAVGARRGLRRGGPDLPLGRSSSATSRSSGIDLDRPKLEARVEHPPARQPRVPRRWTPTACLVRRTGRSTWPRRSRCSSTCPIPSGPLAEMARVARAAPARLGPARAAVARPERGPRRLPARPREHPGPRQPLVQAGLRPRCWPATAR